MGSWLYGDGIRVELLVVLDAERLKNWKLRVSNEIWTNFSSGGHS